MKRIAARFTSPEGGGIADGIRAQPSRVSAPSGRRGHSAPEAKGWVVRRLASCCLVVALGGTGVLVTALSLTVPAAASNLPTVTAVIADTGPSTGGQRVTVIGTGLANPTSVEFGSTVALISSSTSGSVTVTEPPGPAGTAEDVTVTTANGASGISSADDYTYTAPPTAYVINSGSNNVTPVNTLTGAAGANVGVSGNGLGVAVTPDGRYLYVPNYNGTVTPINTATDAAGTSIPGFSEAGAIAISPDGTTAYVGDDGTASATPMTITPGGGGLAGSTIPTDSHPYGIAIAPDGLTAYVSNFGCRTVSAITLATDAVTDTISVDSPRGIAITPNGLTAYVADTNSDTVTPINLFAGGGTAGTPIAVGGSPVGVAISPMVRTAYVVDSTTHLEPSLQSRVFEAASQTAQSTLEWSRLTSLSHRTVGPPMSATTGRTPSRQSPCPQVAAVPVAQSRSVRIHEGSPSPQTRPRRLRLSTRRRSKGRRHHLTVRRRALPRGVSPTTPGTSVTARPQSPTRSPRQSTPTRLQGRSLLR